MIGSFCSVVTVVVGGITAVSVEIFAVAADSVIDCNTSLTDVVVDIVLLVHPQKKDTRLRTCRHC